jgi:cellulose synthase/poly-beta-1,6-N-acetylglucosamine synthase-like glycosyltransferase
MPTILSLAFGLLTLYLVPFFTFMALVTAAALGRRRAPKGVSAGITVDPLPRFIFVIPAYNEEANIAVTVASCLRVSYDPARFRVFVIADNCTDATARVARDAGAEVVERADLFRRSKGYGLEYFFAWMSQKQQEQRSAAGTVGEGRYQFDAAVVVDADTLVDPSLLTRFAEALAGGVDWVQCYYTVRNPDASWRTRLLTYAFSLFNGVWLFGQDRLGLSVGFRGNGMCFTARGLARVPWQAYGLVEDQEFAWMLRIAGERVRFLPEARVYAEMVSQGNAAVSQRRRWEQGRQSLRRKFARPLLTTRALSPFDKALSLIDLFLPPLMPLFTMLGVALAVQPLALWFPALARVARILLPVHALMVLTVMCYAASPFLVLGLPVRYALSLTAVPYYAVWKFLATFRARTTSWVRTQRESGAEVREV